MPSKTHISFLAKAWTIETNPLHNPSGRVVLQLSKVTSCLIKPSLLRSYLRNTALILSLGRKKKTSNSTSLATLRARLGMVWWKHYRPTSTHHGCNIWGLLGLQKSFPDREIRLSPGSPSHWTVNFSWRAACTSGLQQGFQGTDATSRHERNRDLGLEILLAYVYIYILIRYRYRIYVCWPIKIIDKASTQKSIVYKCLYISWRYIVCIHSRNKLL